jgi:hypothetical protein
MTKTPAPAELSEPPSQRFMKVNALLKKLWPKKHRARSTSPLFGKTTCMWE